MSGLLGNPINSVDFEYFFFSVRDYILKDDYQLIIEKQWYKAWCSIPINNRNISTKIKLLVWESVYDSIKINFRTHVLKVTNQKEI